MRALVLYDDSGRLLQGGTTAGTPGDPLPLPEQYTWLEGEGMPSSHYVNDPLGSPVLVERPQSAVVADKASVTADGIEIVTFTGLSAPCAVSVFGGGIYETWTESDSLLEISFDEPGIYSVSFESWPEKRKVIEIVAT